MKDWDKLKQTLKQSKNIAIISHPSPDGDSIGSSLGLYWYLDSNNLRSHVITPDPPPEYLNFLKGFDQIIYPEQNEEEVLTVIQHADILFCLDFNRLDRLKALTEAVRKNNTAYIVNIDHHRDPEDFADFQYCFPNASSTGELIYQFIAELQENFKVNTAIAEALYTGILTDTGSFKFPSTAASTHWVVSKLMEAGLEHTPIHQKVFDNYSKNRLKLIGFALNERLNFYSEFSTAIIHLSDSDLSKFNYQKGDTEGLVNYPLSVNGINFAILITETDAGVKLSFRSKGGFQVNEFSKKHFNGGGHINAAGGISDRSIEATVDKIVELLPTYKDELHY